MSKPKLFQSPKEKKADPNIGDDPKKKGIPFWRKLSIASIKAEMKNANWFKISVIANIAILALIIVGFAGGEIIHQSDTNPNFCAMCHIMQPNVNSYLTSNHMDNIHMQAGVECKECHDYNVIAETTSGINFLIGNYEVNKTGELVQRKYSDSMCLKCHVSYDHIAEQTALLARNPHNNHNGQLPCSSCHISHDAQVDYCSACHENGGQRMIESMNTPLITASDDTGG